MDPIESAAVDHRLECDLPESIECLLEDVQHRHDSMFAEGARLGAWCYGLVMVVFQVLPVAWLTWGLGGSWRLLIQPAILFSIATFLGTLFGGALFATLSVTVARTRQVMRGGVRGFCHAFYVGAVLGAGWVFLWKLQRATQTIGYIWVVHGGQVASSAIFMGSVFALLGSFAGALLVRSRLPRSAVAAPHVRFQFGIQRMLILTTLVAVVIAVPVQMLVRLSRISQLASHSVVFEIMMVGITIMMLMIVVWIVMRGPLIFIRLANSWIQLRQLKQRRDAWKESVFQRDGVDD